MNTLSRFLRLSAISVATIAAAGFWPAAASATVNTDCPGGVCSLLDLFNGSSITINETQFDSWQLSSQATSLASLPDYSLVAVVPIDNPENPGLSFALNGQAAIAGSVAGDFVFFQFGYRVLTTGAKAIGGNGISLTDYGLNGPQQSIDIQETSCQGSFGCALGGPDFLSLAGVSVADGLTQLDAAAGFPAVAELFVDNTLSVFSELDGNSVSINQFEQRFSLVYEPPGLALFAAGLAGLAAGRRRPAARARASVKTH